MHKILLFILTGILPLMAYDFKVTVKWDEMSMTGEAEAILQYYHQGKVEAIRGNLNKPSSDDNVTVNRTFSGGSQEFIIEEAENRLFNIWIVNSLLDESFATEEDFYTLANANVTVWIEDLLNNQIFQVRIPENTAGLVFRAGAIVDGQFYDFMEMYHQQRIYFVTMVDAATGKLLPGVNVAVQDARTGETVETGQTDEYGVFTCQMEYGKYRARFTKPGYLASWHAFEMDLTELPVSMNFAMTPQITEFRIVLTWGPYPKDLDAHLAGPKPEGGNFHIWWSHKTLIGGRDFLDVDDQHSYGPETITIYKPARGVYKYAVHNFSERTKRSSKGLSFSGARVDVYGNGRLQSSFDVPPGQIGNVWNVFRIDENQQIIPVNQMYDEDVSADVIR